MKPQYYLLFFLLLIIASCEDGNDASINTTGKGGSLARFAINGQHLYVVDNTSIQVFTIQQNGEVLKTNQVEVRFGIETIFAKDNHLFLGANDAMYVYDIREPGTPAYVSSYSHFVACDPVVVNGSYAYVTLRITNCGAATQDVLQILDISNVTNPVLINSYALESPYGLGVDGNVLFVCEGNQGLKILDVSDPLNIKLINQYTDLHAYDVIPNNGILLLIGNDGLFQFDYTNLSSITQLSKIEIK